MSQALKDLPDPLQPAPALPASDPDDLLSKMADAAIDQLMADADRGTMPPAPPRPPAMDEIAPAAATPVSPADDEDDFEADEPPPPPKDRRNSGPAAALAVAAAAVDAPVGEAGAVDASATPVVAVSDHATDPAESSAIAPVVAASPAAVPPSPAADVKALLAESTERPSPLLWPLRVINAPFAGMGDHARTLVGLLGVVTLVPTAAAIVWVLFLKK